MRLHTLPFLFLFIPYWTHAQHCGDKVHMSSCEKPHTVNNPDFIEKYGPFATGDKIHFFESVSMNLGKERKLFAYEYDKGTERCVRAVQIPLDLLEGRGHVEDVIHLDNSLVVIHHTFTKKEERVTLYAQAFSVEDLSPISEPVVISKNELTNTSHGPLAVDVRTNSTNDAFLLAFKTDNIDQHGYTVMCYVFNERLELQWKTWKGLAKRHPSGVLYNQVHLLDDGSVFFEALEWNGKLNKTLEESTELKLVRLHHDERTAWDRKLPKGGSLGGVGLLQDGTRNMVGGFLMSETGSGRISEWRIVELDDELQPMVIAKGRLKGSGFSTVKYSALRSDPQGGYFLIGTLDQALVVLSIDAKGKVRWEKTMRSKLPRLPYAFVSDAGLHLAMMAHASDVRSLNSGKGFENAGFQQQPVLLTFDAKGALSVEEIIAAKEGGTRDVIDHGYPDFRLMQRYSAYLDISHDKKRPGLVRVPLN